MTAKIERVLKCPAASDWLKRACEDLLRRDVVDAAHDAEYLAEMFREAARGEAARAAMMFLHAPSGWDKVEGGGER
jgi:hypothetical protein